jgi:hypothetical protein
MAGRTVSDRLTGRRRLWLLARSFGSASILAAAALLLAQLGPFAAHEASAEDLSCPPGTVLFVANFASTSNIPDLNNPNLPPLPPEVQIDVNPGPPGSDFYLITVQACITVQPGQPGIPPVHTIPFTTPTPGGPAFFTPTSTPPPTATPQPPPSTPPTTVPLVTGVLPPNTGDGGLAVTERGGSPLWALPGALLAFVVLSGLDIGVRARKSIGAGSDRTGH